MHLRQAVHYSLSTGLGRKCYRRATSEMDNVDRDRVSIGINTQLRFNKEGHSLVLEGKTPLQKRTNQ